jgi:hypothetical protein
MTPSLGQTPVFAGANLKKAKHRPVRQFMTHRTLNEGLIQIESE